MTIHADFEAVGGPTGPDIAPRALLEAIPDASVIVDARGTIVGTNHQVDLLFGWTATDLVGRPLSQLIPARFHHVLAAPAPDAAGRRVTLLARRRDTTEFPVEIRRNPLGPGVDGLVLTTMRDLSEWRSAQETLFREKEQAVVTLESIADAILTTDTAGRIVYLNPVAERLTGWRTAEAVGLPAASILTFISDTTREPVECPVAGCLAEGRAVDMAEGVLLLRRDGTEVCVSDSAAPVRDRNGVLTGVVMVFHDVTEKRRVSRRLTHEAAHDALTSLFNRAEFERRLSHVVAEVAAGAQGENALCYMDLDRFKLVNDACGHDAGDELLRLIAGLLGKQTRVCDTLARLGGDEFALLLESCPLSEAAEIAGKLQRAVEECHFAWEGQAFSLGISIGVVPITGASGRPASVLRAADAACYAAKEPGGKGVHVEWPRAAARARPRPQTGGISRLARALHEGQFHLFAQAIVPLAPERAMRPRCEILLRLPEDQGRSQPAASFLPQAERYNLMPAIDRWVVRRTIELLSAWHVRHPDCQLPLCSINLSNASLHDATLVAVVRDHLSECGLPPETLCFEITESDAVTNFAETARFLAGIRATGCGVALDDFGNGLNSFAFLKALPVDFLKIGGHYVRGVVDDPVYGAIVTAVNQIGNHLGIATIAGAVETVPVLTRLRTLGVTYAQGYAVSPPEPFASADGTANVACFQQYVA